MIPLTRLLRADYPAHHILCLEPQKIWAELQAETAGWYWRLPDEPGAQWLLALESPFQFCAALLACWQRGLLPVVAPDSLPGTLEQLAPRIAGILSDKPLDHPHLPVLRPSVSPHLPNWRDLDREDTALELFTSGSTGDRQAVRKKFFQLEEELAILAAQWPAAADAARLATVSHFHIYGLLFRLLWPLCSGAPFHQRQYLHWDELSGALPNRIAVIVSSPAHLHHLAPVAAKVPPDWERHLIFSSGGPLAADAACAIAAARGNPPIEVLGSTETGGIAWRCQRHGKEVPWRPLSAVETRIKEGELEVRSPFLPRPDAWLRTGDRAESAAENRFFLRGRVDRIVKVAEKRVSLTEMERKLTQAPGILECRVFPSTKAMNGGRRGLAAVVVLEDGARRRLKSEGKAAWVRRLRDLLGETFEPVVIPRLWRFPRRLPYNSLGKVPMEDLIRQFLDEKDQARTEPVILSRKPLENGLLLEMEVPLRLLFLEGHFPGNPIVPGVCQLLWVREAFGGLCQGAEVIGALRAIKFQASLTPGARFFLELKRKGEGPSWSFRLFNENTRFTTGRFLSRPSSKEDSAGLSKS